MKPLLLTIKGFGPHRDTTVDYSALRSPVAIVGPFGSGKTFTVEGIVATLYGRFVWYSGSIYDALTQGGTGEGLITLKFEHAGVEYGATRIVRDTGKTRTQQAMLLIGSTTVAGPKVGDFDRAIEALIGSADTALSTWFLSQNRANDLCGQPGERELVARRRAAFNELIGAGALDAICDRATDRIQTLTGETRALAALVGSASNLQQAVEDARTAHETAAADLQALQVHLARHEQELETARTALRDADGDDEALKATIREGDGLRQQIADQERTVASLRAEVARLNERAAELPKAQIDSGRARALTDERDGLRFQASAFAAWQSWERGRVEREQAIAALDAEIRGLAASGVDAETRALAATLPAVEAEYRAAERANSLANEANAKIAAETLAVTSHIQRLQHGIKILTSRIEAAPATLFGESCAPCPLMAEYAGLPAERDREQAALDAAEKEHSAISPMLHIEDLTPLIERGAKARAAASAVAAAEQATIRLAELEQSATAARAAMQTHLDREPDRPDDPASRLAEVQAELDRLAGAEERVARAEQAARDAGIKAEDLDVAEARLSALTGRLEDMAPRLDDARATLANREATRLEMERREAHAAERVRQQRLAIEQRTADVGAASRSIEVADQRLAEYTERAADLNAKSLLLEGLKDVRTALGPRGVRQILIDNAAPELEAIADDLFERATGGRMRLRIATQTVLGDGSIAEDFSIMVHDARGERDALRYSGGQLQLIQILFRIAVALWVGNLRGVQPDCLFLDEAFDRLGAEGTEDLLRVLEHLGERMSMIVVVTHDPAIAARLASQIRVRRSALGAEIEVGA